MRVGSASNSSHLNARVRVCLSGCLFPQSVAWTAEGSASRRWTSSTVLHQQRPFFVFAFVRLVVGCHNLRYTTVSARTVRQTWRTDVPQSQHVSAFRRWLGDGASRRCWLDEFRRAGCFQPGSLKHKSCVARSKKPSCSLQRHEQLSRTCLLMRPTC